MQILLFLLFIGLPIAEIAVFIEAGRLIGVLPTILLTIGTAITGAFLMRVQGFATLNRFTQSLEKGEMPVAAVLDGVGIMTAGMLLITPGLLTDLLGFLLFVPPIRRSLARWIVRKAIAGGSVRIRTFGGTGPGVGPKPSPPPGKDGTFTRSDNIVDADFETVAPGDQGASTPLDLEDPEASRKKDRNSPWRKG